MISMKRYQQKIVAVPFDWVKFITGEPLAGMQELKCQELESGVGQLYFHKVQNNREKSSVVYHSGVDSWVYKC